MTILLDPRDDGSLALYIDGDLQFDSRDEAIYHEALALPALALAARRHQGPLRALICGGGDGLAARELLKEPRLQQIDLVDYDPTILELARTELARFNGGSLDNLRVRVTADDAWAFVERAAQARRRYQLIVVDLTAPQDRSGARFHTVDWYRRLRKLLGAGGILAVNASSPSGLAESYWSIYNAVRAAGLPARPLRIALPSFTAEGYGDDWGFLLASPRPIAPAELGDDLPLAGPRSVLRTPEQLRRLFVFPAASAALRASAQPARLGSGLLLHYFYNSTAVDQGGAVWDALSWERDDAPLPPADDGRHLLPPELRASLAAPPAERPDEQALLRRVLDLMPALQRGQTRAMIGVFLEAPERFLAAVDLGGLVERLLRRAAELPRRLVAELRLLRRALVAYAGNHAALLRLGMHVVTILTVVVILSNLFYPDAVYGKGGEGSGGAYTGDTISLSQPGRSTPNQAASPSLASGGGFRDRGLGRTSTVDELGKLYPTRRYRYYPSYHSRGGYYYHRTTPVPTEPVEEEVGAFRLTPDTDILPDGKVAILVSERAYLILSDEFSTLTDSETGMPLLFLKRDRLQIWQAAREIERQKRGLEGTTRAKESWLRWMGWLEFAPWRDDDERELTNLRETAALLDKALASLGAVPDSQPAAPEPPLAGARDLLSGVWMTPAGDQLVLELPEGTVFLDRQGWYRDQARAQPFEDPYPESFRGFILQEIDQRLRDRAATTRRIEETLRDADTTLAALLRDRTEYNGLTATTGPNELVEYGTEQITLAEARRRTDADIASTELLIAALKRDLADLPQDLSLAATMRESLRAQ